MKTRETQWTLLAQPQPTTATNLLTFAGDFFQMFLFAEGKSPEVPFHGITSPYSYFEVIWIFAPIQQEAKHDQEKLSAELN